MMKEKSTFSISNLTEKEKAEREESIEALFNGFLQAHPELTRKDAEGLFDKMQQKAIEAGKSVWKYYKHN